MKSTTSPPIRSPGELWKVFRNQQQHHHAVDRHTHMVCFFPSHARICPKILTEWKIVLSKIKWSATDSNLVEDSFHWKIDLCIFDISKNRGAQFYYRLKEGNKRLVGEQKTQRSLSYRVPTNCQTRALRQESPCTV